MHCFLLHTSSPEDDDAASDRGAININEGGHLSAKMMILDFITKGINKAIAPTFLRWSLRVHQSLPASSMIPSTAISLLPLAQRLVSIEVQDDYRQLGAYAQDGLFPRASRSFDEFVERAWNVLGLEHWKRPITEKQQQTTRVKAEPQIKPIPRQERTKTQNRPKSNRKDIVQNELFVQLGEQRLKILEQYLLPALLPMTSIYNSPQTFVKWIRGEYLIAKYGLFVQEAIRRHPELRDDAAGLSRFGAQTIDGTKAEFPLDAILPTVKTVRHAFDMHDWSICQESHSSWENDNENIKHTDQLTIEDIIHHRLQGQIAFSGPLNAYFEMRRRDDSYELWTRDYIFGLANYFLQRIKEMNKESGHDKDTTILDVGAGDGRLIYFLRRAIKEIVSSHSKMQPKRDGTAVNSSIPTLIATDDGSWGAPIYKGTHIQVEQLSVVDAMEKYGQELELNRERLIVICSWMPPGEDWTHLFRQPVKGIVTEQNDFVKHMHNTHQKAVSMVEEYVLIGECNANCGHSWHTWGYHEFHSMVEDGKVMTGPAPYVQDGYTRVDLEDLSRLQFSRFDCKRSSESRTVSFRRGKL